ncbi:MAG: GNAT family protein [Bacteroidota bacterium]|nr:GNAT family protein [Bacteroidota bacterium]
MIGKSIRLRALEPTDVDVLYNWENDTSVWKVSNTLTPFSKFVIEEYIACSHNDIYTTKQLRLIIELKETCQSIGAIDLFDFDPCNRRVGIGILIGEKDFRSKGYASEALELMIKYVFNTLNLHQLYCNILTDNEQSINLFSKFGFKTAGLKKDWIFYNNKWYDELLLQLIEN